MKYRPIIASLLLLLPRTNISYVFYSLAPLLILNVGNKTIIKTLFVFFVFSALFVLNFIFYDVSLLAFLLECALILPLVIFSLGGKVSSSNGLRFISLMAFLFSIYNMMNVGFPFLLPYIDYLPDYFSAFYGKGGAKMVTIIGFFSLVVESQKFKANNIGWFVVALANFIVPNFIIGIACGVLALVVSQLRNNKTVLFSLILVAMISPYVIYRLINIDNTLMDEFGYHPKILAYISLVKLWVEHPHTVFIGVGLGQFCSYPALWASDYMAAFSTHSIPELPYFSMSEFHDRFLGEYLQYGEVNKWALSSSANKPYTSFTALIAEMGVVIVICFICILLSYFKKMNKEYRHAARPIVMFVFLIFLIDIWHDVPVFIFCLLLCLHETKELSSAKV